MAYPPASLMTKWGTVTDGSFRATRLAPTENDVKQAIDDIVAELGSDPSGAYASVQARLDAFTAAATGMKLSVRAATVVGGTYNIATSFAAGQVLDGVTLVAGNSILVSAMISDKTVNGVYTVNASGAPTRRSDFAAGGDFPGSVVLVREGTANKGKLFYCSNASAPNLGSSNVFFLALATRPVEITIGAVGSVNYDFVCDGVDDQDQFNAALFLMASGGGTSTPGASILPTAIRGALRLGPGDFTLSGSIALSLPNSGKGVEMVGVGREGTRILRSADVVAVDISGSASGSATHSGPIRIADLKFTGPSTSGYVNPAVKAYFAQDVRIDRVDFASMQGPALVGMELQDTVLTGCRFSTVGSSGLGLRSFASGGGGSTGTGGRPAILLLGDTDTSGAGHATLPCSNVTISESVFANCVDGAVVVHGNAAGENFVAQTAIEHNGIALRNVRFDVSAGTAGWAPQVYVYRARNVSLDIRVASGSNFAGGTPQALVDVDTVAGLSISRYSFSLTTAAIRAGLRVKDVTGFDWTTITFDQATGTFQAGGGVVEVLGTSTLVRRGTIARISGSGTYTPVVGTPATEFQTNGTASLAIGATTVSVNHRLPRAPVDGEVVWSVCQRPSGGAIPDVAISYSPTQITFTAASGPVGSALVLAWTARVGDGG